jgi:hypothetical protein
MLQRDFFEMSYETDTARRYRLHATRLRAMATTYQDREASEALGRVAESYELLAHVFDGIDEAGLTSLRIRMPTDQADQTLVNSDQLMRPKMLQR